MSGCSASSWIVFKGPVHLVQSENGHKDMYMEAWCGSSKGEPAKLKIYTEFASTVEGKTVVKEILFTNIKRAYCPKDHDRRVIAIEMFNDADQLLFYANSVGNSTRWFKYCALLLKIPCYFIPKLANEKLGPKENTISQHIFSQYTNDLQRFNATCMWSVYIPHEGIAKINNISSGVYTIIICSRDSMFTVHGPTGKLLLSWDSEKIKQSGCIRSMVFLETHKGCIEGTGLLWMKPKSSQAAALRQCLQHLLGSKSINQLQPLTHNSCDAALSTWSNETESDSSYDSLSPLDLDQRVDIETLSVSNISTQPFVDTENSSDLNSQCMPSSQVSNSFTSSEYFSGSSTLVDQCSNSTLCEVVCSQGYCKHFLYDENKLRQHSSGESNSYTATVEPSNKLESFVTQTASTIDSCSQDHASVNPFFNKSRKASSPSQHPTSRPKDVHIKHSSSDSKIPSSHDAGSQQSSDCSRFRVNSEKASIKKSLQPDKLCDDIDFDAIDAVEAVQIEALKKCHSVISKKLDIGVIKPFLHQHNLLTTADILYLLHESRSHKEIADYLVTNLPRKQEGWFGLFIKSLEQSTSGTGHDLIFRTLKTEYKSLQKYSNRQNASKNTRNTSELEESSSKVLSDEASSATMMYTSQPLDIKNIAELVIPNMAFTWYEMGIQLGVNQNELDIIKHDYQDSKKACLKMFTEWLNDTQAEKSWDTLLKSLHSHSVGQSSVANNLIKKLSNDSQ